MSELESAPLTCQVIPSGPELWLTLQPVWVELLVQVDENSAFLSPTWVGCWLDHFGEQLRTVGLVWRDPSGRAVGCALLSSSRGRIGPIKVSRTFLNASGASHVGCEHNDVLVLPPYRGSVLDDLVRRIVEAGKDELVLAGMRDGVARDVTARWPGTGSSGYMSESPFVSLRRIREEGGQYLDRISPNTRYQITRSIRLYSGRFGEPTIEIAATGEQARAWLDEMISLHEKRWRAVRRSGAFASRATRMFHHRLIERVYRGDTVDSLSIEIVRLRFGERTVGVLQHLVYKGIVSFYQSGFRYDDDARLKPGMVSHALSIQHALQQGHDEYDFLAGEPYPVRYKRSLSTDARSLSWNTLNASNLKMKGVGRIRRIRGLLRRLASGSDSDSGRPQH